ncbi:MAG: 4Fe-4S binding protein [Desulfovibrio sp.]
MNMAECIMCLRCVSACPHHAASVRFVWQKKKTRTGSIPQACAERKGGAA